MSSERDIHTIRNIAVGWACVVVALTVWGIIAWALSKLEQKKIAAADKQEVAAQNAFRASTIKSRTVAKSK